MCHGEASDPTDEPRAADTGYFYVTKEPAYQARKVELKKYDLRARKHVTFRNQKSNRQHLRPTRQTRI